MNEKELFREVYILFQSKYDGLDMDGTLVCYHGEPAFNTDGFNLLYNLTRLCDLLKGELV